VLVPHREGTTTFGIFGSQSDSIPASHPTDLAQNVLTWWDISELRVPIKAKAVLNT